MDTIMQLGPPGARQLMGRSALHSHLLLQFLKESACRHEVGHTLFSISDGGMGVGRGWGGGQRVTDSERQRRRR